MIASISGRIADIDEGLIVVEVGGVGLQIFVPANLVDDLKVGAVISLFTHLIVRETELSLYGFYTKEDRQYFVLLLGVNGIGPRLSLGILSTLNPTTIRQAVFNEQVDVFNRVSGVGKKTAQKILLHMQDKVVSADGLEPVAAMDDTDSEVLAALTSMGFSVVEAQSAIQIIPKDAPEDVEERLRIALSYFSPPDK